MFFAFIFGICLIFWIGTLVLSKKRMAQWKKNNGVPGVILAWLLFIFLVSGAACVVLAIIYSKGNYQLGPFMDAALVVVLVSAGLAVLTMFTAVSVAELRRGKGKWRV